VRDPLTQLYNRRYLDDILHRELTTAKRRGWQVGVILGDIDHFKQINDRFGHATGDKVLVSIASTLVEGVRGSDIVCRFGGEEFIIVLPGASLEIARSRAEAIRAAISDIGAGDEGKDRYRVTISLGVSSYPANGQDAVSLLREADIALYKAKNNGRNQVAVAEQAPVV
jgi:diguanylate cyclase (GGDEF)-like protein